MSILLAMSTIDREGFCPYEEYAQVYSRRTHEQSIASYQLYQLYLRLRDERRAVKSVVLTTEVCPIKGMAEFALDLTFLHPNHKPKFELKGRIFDGVWVPAEPEVLRVNRQVLTDGILIATGTGEADDESPAYDYSDAPSMLGSR